MEGPTDLRVQPYTPARIFTVTEANALLTRLQDLFHRMDPKVARLRELEDLVEDSESYWGSPGDTMPPDERATHDRLARERDEARASLDEDIREVNAMGCELKDVASGLVDFPAFVEGSLAYLCWQRGERRIEQWHTLESGFAGRKPLPPALQTER